PGRWGPRRFRRARRVRGGGGGVGGGGGAPFKGGGGAEFLSRGIGFFFSSLGVPLGAIGHNTPPKGGLGPVCRFWRSRSRCPPCASCGRPLGYRSPRNSFGARSSTCCAGGTWVTVRHRGSTRTGRHPPEGQDFLEDDGLHRR